MNLKASGIPRKQLSSSVTRLILAEQMCHLWYAPSVIKSRSHWAEKWKDLQSWEGTPCENALPATLSFLNQSTAKLSGICWLQLSRCHPEGKVSPRWLNTPTSNTDTAHAAETSDCCIYFTLLVGKQRIQVSFKSSSALEEEEQKEDKSLFSKGKILGCFLCLKSCNWCFLECQKTY